MTIKQKNDVTYFEIPIFEKIIRNVKMNKIICITML